MNKPAAGEAADVEAELLVEDVGEFIAVLDGGDGVDDLHLDRKIGDVVQRPAEQQAHHEEQHAGGIEEQGVGQTAQRQTASGRW